MVVETLDPYRVLSDNMLSENEGFRRQEGESLNRVKLRQNGIVSLMIRPAVFLAGGRARVKLHVAETVKRLNVEHRTSNIERRIWMTLSEA